MESIARPSSASAVRNTLACLAIVLLIVAALDATRVAAATADGYESLRVPGSMFRPRDTSTTYTYGSGGCVEAVSGSSLFVYPLHLPQGATVRRLRIYYRDNSASYDVAGYLTVYDSEGGFSDLASTASSGSGGFGSAVTTALSYVVNDLAQAPQILASIPVDSSSTLLFCGARISYDIGNDGIFKNGFES